MSSCNVSTSFSKPAIDINVALVRLLSHELFGIPFFGSHTTLDKFIIIQPEGLLVYLQLDYCVFMYLYNSNNNQNYSSHIITITMILSSVFYGSIFNMTHVLRSRFFYSSSSDKSIQQLIELLGRAT